MSLQIIDCLLKTVQYSQVKSVILHPLNQVENIPLTYHAVTRQNRIATKKMMHATHTHTYTQLHIHR